MKRTTTSFMIAPLAAGAFFLWPGLAASQVDDLTAVEIQAMELGKKLFFDTRLSSPRGMACASCHDPANGWTHPDSEVNAGQVGAPGASFGKNGGIKPPANAYASFSPPFQQTPGGGGFGPPPFIGGNFWDGRAEGHGALGLGPLGNSTDTITVDDLGPNADVLAKYLGPTADQALNPIPNPVEQNYARRNVCNVARYYYRTDYQQAFGEDINCRPRPVVDGQAPVDTAFKRLMLAIAAWQASPEVNSFTSKRDECIREYEAMDEGERGESPFALSSEGGCSEETMSLEAKYGHDIFYGLNESGENDEERLAFGPGGQQLAPINAACTTCHVGVPDGDAPDPVGKALRQLYSDNRYHHLQLPFNAEMEVLGVGSGDVKGLSAHLSQFETTDQNGNPVVNDVADGEFRTPTLRNVAKKESEDFVKAFMHNGYFKTPEQVIHWYNTGLDFCDNDDNAPGPPPFEDRNGCKERCEDLDIVNATVEQAMDHNCWPDNTEFPNEPGAAPGFIAGDLELTPEEEAALVAYMESLTDELDVNPTGPVYLGE